MFKMKIWIQTDNHNLRKNIAGSTKYILRKIDLKLRNPKFNNLCSIIFCVIKCEPFGIKRSMRSFWNKQKWLNKIVCLKL